MLAASTELKIKTKISSRTLLVLPFILREEGSGTRKSFEQHIAEKNLQTDQLNTCAVLGSSTAVTEAIKSNLGVSILSHHAVEDAVAHNQIQLIEIENMHMTRNFYTVTAKKRSLPHHYQAFLKYLLPAGNNK